MADEVEQAAAKKGFPKKTIGIVLGIALLQGGAFFAVFKMAGGGPDPALADAAATAEEEGEMTTAGAEVVLLKAFKVPNDKSGRMIIYDIDISVVVPQPRREPMVELVEERSGEIADRVARIIRGATPEMLGEDDLTILRDQIHRMLLEIVGDETLVRRVLIPRLVPIPA